MRNFFKKTSVIGLEEYLKQALETKSRYCHNFIKIPRAKEPPNLFLTLPE
jgi:hypothetical protein